ncbi:molybdopterin-containing oxidoreductase family protein [Pseudonocardia sp. CA-107938]|uniref:molybdopterin-containing oxidoreductase family protein n=1 Tax=Pseudonocardia sp. CA-107938 TaxID=3240021 RepID=UPI003D94136B
MSSTRSTYCRICVAGCGLLVDVVDEQVVKVRGDAAHPLSAGYTCAKGRALPLAHADPLRLDHPGIGRPRTRRAVTWDELYTDLGGRLEAIIARHGPDAVAFFNGSGAGMDAAATLLGRALAKAVGTRSLYSSLTIDAPAKPLVGSLVAGQPGLFALHPDYARTSLTLLVGSNPVVSHGHTSATPNPRARLRTLLEHGEVWVVDPRRTETAGLATRHLAPRPGTDHIWLAAMVRELLPTIDRPALGRTCTGLDHLTEAVERFTLPHAADVTGIPLADLQDLRAALVRHRRFAGVTGTGVTMSPDGALAQWLLLVLGVITDSVDAAGGTLVNPGFLRSLDRGRWRGGEHRPAPGPRSRPELPRQYGEYPAVALLDEIEAGNVRAVVVLGANLASCLPDAERARSALGGVDVLAVADVVENGMTELATHLLPAAAQLERADITFVTDQYAPDIAAQYTPAVVAPAADRRDLGRILTELGSRLGHDLMHGRPYSAETVFADAMRSARSDFATLAGARVLVDPEPAIGWVRRGVAERGGWNLAPSPLIDALRAAHAPPPGTLRLVPSRRLTHFNSQLTSLSPNAGLDVASMNPDDAREHGLTDGAEIVVSSANGAVRARLRVDPRLARGVVAVPHGFEETNVNLLTSGTADVDALTGMPAFSAVAVRVERATADPSAVGPSGSRTPLGRR